MLKAQPDLADINDLASDLARKQAADLIGGLTKAKKKIVRRLVAESLESGWSQDKLTRRIQEQVGLDERYSRAVENYRKKLISEGQTPYRAGLAAKQYAKRLRRHRAEVIARYEVQKVLLDAQRAIWTQQQEDGDLSRYAVRVWRVHKDERRCAVCRPMNGRRASLKKGGGYEVKGVGFVPGPPTHPQCRCFEELEDKGVVKTDPALWGTPAKNALSSDRGGMGQMVVEKHLAGLHDQKTHGRKSGLRPDIISHLERAVEGGGLTRDFALAILDLGARFPNVAKHVRGIDLDAQLSGVGYASTNNYGHVISFDEEQAQRDVAKLANATSVNGIPARDAKRYAYAVAVHEWGHAVHSHVIAHQQGQISLGALQHAMDSGTGIEGVPQVSDYAGKNGAERFAEWFAAGFLGYFQNNPDWRVPAMNFVVDRAVERDVDFTQGRIIAKTHVKHHHRTFEGSLVERYAKQGRGRTLGPDFKHRDLLGD